MPPHAQIPFAPRARRFAKSRPATAESEKAAHAQFRLDAGAPARATPAFPTQGRFGARRDGVDPLFEYLADERRRNGIRTQ